MSSLDSISSPAFAPATSAPSAASSSAPSLSQLVRAQAAPVPAPAQAAPPAKRFILVTCRPTTKDENTVLNAVFSQIVVYHPELHSGRFDLSSMAFDLLVVDISNDSSRNFLATVHKQANAQSLPIIVLKKSMPNYKDMVKALGALVISAIEEFENDNLLLALTKTKIPKVAGRVKHLLLRCFSVASALQ